jgi:F0F1-type ATP synthase membrane subunit c/vacuolar-type H+-ATPase subunit K
VTSAAVDGLAAMLGAGLSEGLALADGWHAAARTRRNGTRNRKRDADM